MVWGLVASMYVGNIMLLILNLPLVGVFIRILSIPPRWLFPLVLAVSFVGVYSVHNSALDLILASLLGLIGFLMRKFDFPLAPVILGLVLGDLMERSLRQALMISGGEVGILFQSGIAKTLFGLAIFVVVAPKLLKNMRGFKRKEKS
ncbi:MAG: tripartite tricarboxylate transporter permease [Deltaproteobacteria bacterium]|nr:tripartite tricarboxylate transporter permease [Deltaproteobacteria bacterium]